MVEATLTGSKMSRFTFTSAEEYLGKIDLSAFIHTRRSLHCFGIYFVTETCWEGFDLKPLKSGRIVCLFLTARSSVLFYLSDAVTQLLEHKQEYTQFGLTRYFAE